MGTGYNKRSRPKLADGNKARPRILDEVQVCHTLVGPLWDSKGPQCRSSGNSNGYLMWRAATRGCGIYERKETSSRWTTTPSNKKRVNSNRPCTTPVVRTALKHKMAAAATDN